MKIALITLNKNGKNIEIALKLPSECGLWCGEIEKEIKPKLADHKLISIHFIELKGETNERTD